MSNYPDGFGSRPEDYLEPRSPLHDEREYAVDNRIDIEEDPCEGCSCTVECCRARGTE
jgi:hypothetical protein